MVNELMLNDVLEVLAAAPGNRVTETELIASLRGSRSFSVNTYGKLARRWVIPAWEVSVIVRMVATAGVTVEQVRTKSGCVRSTYFSL